jgi:4-amino-4-deoxy-L-arabinose transferase-like glycosyltransferase
MKFSKIGDQQQINTILLVFSLLLLLPAYFINLGIMPFILDESTRAVVALEMIHSGDYIVPTLNGEFYYNKPPLFNWILIVFIKIFGSDSEWVYRLPVVLSMFLFGLSIYQTQKKELGRNIALFSAIVFITCGRILIYDSLKGLIDITFSWIVYMVIWFIWKYSKKENWVSLFLSVWGLTAVAFLLKGLPALVFLGISLLCWFIAEKKFRLLFSLPSIFGFLLFAVITGTYFYFYHQSNDLGNYIATLFTESSKRTFLDNQLYYTIRHLFTFPFEFIYHFLPWTIFILALFHKDRLRMVISNPFTRFLTLMFISNILIYWVSPAIYARYLFVFVPLFSGIVLYAYVEGKFTLLTEKYILYPAILIMIAGITVLIILSPVIADISIYNFFWLKYVIVLILLALPVFLLIKFKPNLILVLFAVLLVMRITFNLFILPDRYENDRENYRKNGALVTGEICRNLDVYLLGDTRIKHISTFYYMIASGKTLKRWKDDPLPGGYYIIEKEKASFYPSHKTIFVFETEIYNIKLALIRLDDEVKY